MICNFTPNNSILLKFTFFAFAAPRNNARCYGLPRTRVSSLRLRSYLWLEEVRILLLHNHFLLPSCLLFSIIAPLQLTRARRGVLSWFFNSIQDLHSTLQVLKCILQIEHFRGNLLFWSRHLRSCDMWNTAMTEPRGAGRGHGLPYHVKFYKSLSISVCILVLNSHHFLHKDWVIAQLVSFPSVEAATPGLIPIRNGFTYLILMKNYLVLSRLGLFF